MNSIRYRVGVIGATGRGNYGHALAETYAQIDSAQVVAVADADPDGLAAAGTKLGAEHRYADYVEMLDQQQLDLITICPRWPDQRRDMVIAAAQSGIKGIFCEKPFAPNLVDADAMVEACDSNGVRLVVAHRRASGYEQRLKQLVDDGVIGDVEVLRGHGKADHRAGSLDLMVLGTHILDGMRYVAGSDAAWAHGHVTQDRSALTTDDIHEGDEGVGLLAGNRVAAYYEMRNGITMHYESLQGHAADGHEHSRNLGFEVYGSKGILSIRNAPAGELYLHRHPLWLPDTDERPWERIVIPEWDKLANHTLASNLIIVNELIAAIEADRPVAEVSSGADALATTEMIMAVHESNRLGRRVALPLENRHNPYATWLAESR